MNETYEILLNFLQEKRDLKDSEKINSLNKFLEQIGLSQSDMYDHLAELFRKNRISLDEIINGFNAQPLQFLQVVSVKYNLEFYDLDNLDIDYRIIENSNIAQLKRYSALPVKDDDNNVYVAFKNPFDIIAQDSIQALFNNKILKVVLALPVQIERHIAKFELNESVKDLIINIRRELADNVNIDKNEQNSGILKLIEIILKTAISQRASDIHIEPTATNCIIRSRIDGMLNETFVFDKDIYAPMASCLKLLSNMDIAERRKPQDGRFSTQILEREYDFRVSTLPIVDGESIVLRVLDKSRVIVNIKNLGMSEQNLDKFQSSMHQPYGIVLVTGPTGSGKTTTLYAGLNDIKSIKSKIITVEDPVEYQLSLIQQVSVNERAGISFANALRSILRQDPDVIMVGEIRDHETLRIAVSAALTGHLVFSTLHTNDTFSAITRIADMGIEPYLISGSLISILSQRLVRKLCPHCKVKFLPSYNQLSKIEHLLPNSYEFFSPVGCSHCSQTGYLGREMVGEILTISNELQSMIARQARKEELLECAIKDGFKDTFSDALWRAAKGITSLEEVYRVVKI